MSEQKEIYRTDWLASHPVFYNEKTGQASHTINDVIDFNNFEFHPEGFNNYLNYGFSVFEQTPIKHVKFLRYSSRLLRDEKGNLEVEYLDDPAEKLVGQVTQEEDVWEQLEAYVRARERECDGEIVIPTSGGYDSRVLNYFIKDKSRVRTFTFGMSEPQKISYEVVHAQKLSKLLGTQWQHIKLGDFHQYFDKWDALYGISTHAHGMYQIDFYSQVGALFPYQPLLLSGIIGDAWAGGKGWPAIDSPEDVIALGLSHKMNASSEYSLIPSGQSLRDEYFQREKEKLQEPDWRVIESMRFKMTLLSYLLRVPEHFGFVPKSPYLDLDISLAMLSLPDARRKNRQWQTDFFREQGVCLEDMALGGLNINTLHLQALKLGPLPPLDVDILREVIQVDYIRWVNRSLEGESFLNLHLKRFLGTPKLGGALKRLGIKKDPFRIPYFVYLTLKPIETLLCKRNNG